jgi:outer membrane protein OmpA-like peptidoglycan-associated protein
MPSVRTIAIAAAALLLLGPLARAQDDADSQSGLSRPMRVAIRFYERGDDTRAMDRFMEILTKGDPSERSMANEYINLITHRMNTGGGYGGSPAPKPGVAPAADAPAAVPAPAPRPAPPEPPRGEIVTEDMPARAPAPVRIEPAGEAPAVPAPAAAPRSRGRARPERMSQADRALMRKEIKARLHSAQERSLAALKGMAGLRVVMRDNGDPKALGIPSGMLFDSGILFRRDASRLLDPLTKLVFALGSTQVLILPEGTATGDAKVLDMRRTMGISAHLFEAGVAPPRVRVNLLNTQVDIPAPLADFKGVVIVFLYDQPMSLSVDTSVGEDLGPPISLGVFPPEIRPDANQGAVIEFSVSDPPAGLVSWTFRLLQPSDGGQELAPLQEVVGGGPVFHQIFWNARRDYFGEPLPGGRYECELSALDAKNRRRTLHRWIQVIGAKPASRPAAAAAPEPAAAPAAAEPAVKVEAVPARRAAPGEDLAGGGASLVKGVHATTIRRASVPAPRGRVVRRAATRARRKREADRGRAARAAEPRPKAPAKRVAKRAPKPKATPGRYDLGFVKNTHRLTDAGQRELSRAAGDLAAFPLATMSVAGRADASETDAASLADKRAKMVAGLLINRYQVDPNKIQVASSVGGGADVKITFEKGN